MQARFQTPVPERGRTWESWDARNSIHAIEKGEDMQRFMMALASQGALASLLLRLMMAEIVIIAGYKKVFVAGFGAVIGSFTKYGIPLPEALGPFIAALELLGGICLAIGLGTRYLGLLFACEFVVAAYTKWVTLGEGYLGGGVRALLLFLRRLAQSRTPGAS